MKFLVDNQLPPALARLIEEEFGAEATHVADLGLRDASDAEIWNYASAYDLVVLSKDDDFVSIVMQSPIARFIWVRTGNCRRAILLDVFRMVWLDLFRQLKNGERFIEIR